MECEHVVFAKFSKGPLYLNWVFLKSEKSVVRIAVNEFIGAIAYPEDSLIMSLSVPGDEFGSDEGGVEVIHVELKVVD